MYPNINPAEQRQSPDDVLRWLESLRPTKAAYRGSPAAYSMKHVVEKILGRYVSEGEVVTAAEQLGYPVWHNPPHRGTGALIGVNRRDYQAEWNRVNR